MTRDQSSLTKRIKKYLYNTKRESFRETPVLLELLSDWRLMSVRRRFEIFSVCFLKIFEEFQFKTQW